MTTQTLTKWNKIRFGDLLEATIKVPLKKGDVYDSLPMDLVSNSSKFPESFEPKVFNGSGTRFADGDTVFARITPCLQNGKIAKIKNLKGGIGFGSTEFFIFRGKEGFADPDYIFYVAKTAEIRGPAEKSMTGASGRQRADKGVVENVIINAPDLSTQMQIADVLSTYDDLIENNNRRIKILEDIAQKIYTEWFVNYRFPGYENTKFGKDGLPEGWEIKHVEDLIKRVSAGKKYENKTVVPVGKVPVLDQGKTGIIGYHNDEPGVEASIESPIIVFANHTCYQNLIMFSFSAIQNVLPFLPTDGRNIYWLHFATKDLISFNDYKGHWPEFMTKKLVVPTVEMTEKFGEQVRENVVFKYKLEKTNEILKKSRDLLIPQLVTGKLEIKP